MKIWYLPIERLAERYTDQMYDWVVQALMALGVDYAIIEGSEDYAAIESGEWLDTNHSVAWKLSQIQRLSEAIASGVLESGDRILLGDVWMPGIEAVKFQLDLLGHREVRIGGWHYAGCFDHFDFLAKNLGPAGPKFELMLLEGVLDSVAFGSPFHQKFVARHARLPSHTFDGGLAWNHADVAAHKTPEKHARRVVAYTHRIAPEKRPDEFMALAARFADDPTVEFAFSTNGVILPALEAQAGDAGCTVVQHKTKADYYKWLSGCTAMWSGADQETFGYSFMEAVALGVPVVAPYRACYPDHFARCAYEGKYYLYDRKDAYGEQQLRDVLSGEACAVPEIVSEQYSGSHLRYISEFLGAFA